MRRCRCGAPTGNHCFTKVKEKGSSGSTQVSRFPHCTQRPFPESVIDGNLQADTDRLTTSSCTKKACASPRPKASPTLLPAA
ncbi:BZ3500_MvSof-1268-A1-R1_Chr7-3g09568 [Microbotryum saponariae]|uniref:BZ3500_MvSof-1268-A1-R1_Chr7-3g09568 protein n=1 Tax=Microbotryum saponariae TaxID=289078 RepID=A0A2X0KX69_9BASI|nr:BZ3501_MvSof-1269-A2-R1_Chr7-2g09291 [Microbotryum saponariae]SDA02217.1 BZ3500_MvSof-1268-A1-R1_Chr7-3g09568 [Microbotryum saponariae]